MISFAKLTNITEFLYRTNDVDGIVWTILHAKKFVYLSVMDFLPASSYSKYPISWPAFFDPLVTAATTKGIEVKLLISYWAHSNVKIVPYLKALESTVAACRNG